MACIAIISITMEVSGADLLSGPGGDRTAGRCAHVAWPSLALRPRSIGRHSPVMSTSGWPRLPRRRTSGSPRSERRARHLGSDGRSPLLSRRRGNAGNAFGALLSQGCHVGLLVFCHAPHLPSARQPGRCSLRRTAICRCGGCAIDVQGEPIMNLVCHCSSCKRRTGGPCGWTVTFRDDQVLDRRGEFTTYHSKGTAGRVVNSFCSICGTTLFFAPQDYPGIIGCAGGCFVEDPLGDPVLSASDDQRCAWLSLPHGWQVRS